MSSEYLFVYGSLRRDYSSPARQVLDDHAEFVSEAIFQGKLYKIEWYPGVVPSDEPVDNVIGEVYKITDKDEVFSKLDQYEGCSPADPQPHAFVRKEMRVRLKKGPEINAWIYLYEWSVDDKKQIPSGDYLDHKE